MIEITPHIQLAENEIDISFIRASGPGGQNVNKVASAVHLRFNALKSPSLPEAVRRRLLRLAGNRLSSDGFIVIKASRHRSQDLNRRDALDRLADLIRQACVKQKKRRPTRPSRAARQRRLDSKRQRSGTKKMRQSVRRTAE